MIEDSKAVSRRSKTKKEGQWNDQKKKKNNDITQQTKEQAKETLHNTSVELWWPTMVSSFSFICDTGRVTIATNNKIMNEKMTGLWLQQA